MELEYKPISYVIPSTYHTQGRGDRGGLRCYAILKSWPKRFVIGQKSTTQNSSEFVKYAIHAGLFLKFMVIHDAQKRLFTKI